MSDSDQQKQEQKHLNFISLKTKLTSFDGNNSDIKTFDSNNDLNRNNISISNTNEMFLNQNALQKLSLLSQGLKRNNNNNINNSTQNIGINIGNNIHFNALNSVINSNINNNINTNIHNNNNLNNTPNNQINLNNNINNNNNNLLLRSLSTTAPIEQSHLVKKYVPEFPDPLDDIPTTMINNNNNNNINNNNNNNNNNNSNIKYGKDVKIITDANIPVEFAILGQPPKSNHINVSADHRYGIRNYLVRARRMLRLEEDCIICGIGSAVATACEVAEVLKREKIGEFKCIKTDIDSSDQPYIRIELKRGCYAHLVSDFRRRKIIEIFENNDTHIKGFLDIQTIKNMELDKKFKPDKERIKQANNYLKSKKDLNLPEFVYYCSILVHPLLLEYHFKTAIQQLGGVVDVHEGDLPVKQSPSVIATIQSLGIVPTPEQLNELFPKYSNMHRDKDITILQHKQLYHETHPKGARNDIPYQEINQRHINFVNKNNDNNNDNNIESKDELKNDNNNNQNKSDTSNIKNNDNNSGK